MWVDIGSSLEMLECLTGQNKDALKDSLGPMREKPHQNMIVLQNNNLKLEQFRSQENEPENLAPRLISMEVNFKREFVINNHLYRISIDQGIDETNIRQIQSDLANRNINVSKESRSPLRGNTTSSPAAWMEEENKNKEPGLTAVCWPHRGQMSKSFQFDTLSSRLCLFVDYGSLFLFLSFYRQNRTLRMI